MSKRPANSHYGFDGKKPKLDISRSNHSFPLSQYISSSNDNEKKCDEWGDDDDELLLQASQAAEEGQINDLSLLPDYGAWKQPGSTSTQYQSSPSTLKSSFEFKKPSSNIPSHVSTHLKNKCSTISSPLPGISTMSRDRHSSLADDLAISDKIVSGQESDIRRRMLQLEEENQKLKSEFGKLSDKIVTKEGEASILRSQLRASQLASDNIRMEKIRAQERVQMECNEKLAAITKEMQSLKAQLEFKDLEILNAKDKFKKLEANKLRLTQVTEISSHRNNNILTAPYDTISEPRKAKTTSNGVQTSNKRAFLKLNKFRRKGFSNPLLDMSEFREVTEVLADACHKLQELLCARADECYSAPIQLLHVTFDQLLDPQPLYKDERGAGARCALARLSAALEDLATDEVRRLVGSGASTSLFDTIAAVCRSIARTPCSILYSGALTSLVRTFDSLHARESRPAIFAAIKDLLECELMGFAALELLTFVRRAAGRGLRELCPERADTMDVDGDTDSCHLSSLLRHADALLASLGQANAHAHAHAALRALRALRDLLNLLRTSECACRAQLERVLRRARLVGAELCGAKDTVVAELEAELIELRNSYQIDPEAVPRSYLQRPIMSSFEDVIAD